MSENILPVINTEVLQQKANEYAMKGAEDALKDFYTSYDSPYKKAIKANLENKGLDYSFSIPDIIGVLNDKFSEEVDQIANQAIAKSFLPIVKEFLTRETPEVKFSYILKKFIEATNFEYNDLDIEDYRVEKIEEERRDSSFFTYTISNGAKGYELRFYKNSKDRNEIMALPYMLSENGRFQTGYKSQQTMKISLEEGATLELPFTKSILEDPFTSFIARLVIGNNNIIFDVDYFDEDMFPRNDCHCH